MSNTTPNPNHMDDLMFKADEAIAILKRKESFLRSVLEQLESYERQMQTQKQKTSELKLIDSKICTIEEEPDETDSSIPSPYDDDDDDDHDDDDISELSEDDDDSFAEHDSGDEWEEEKSAHIAALPTESPALSRVPSRRGLQRRCSVTKFNLESALSRLDYEEQVPVAQPPARPQMKRFASLRAMDRRCSVTKFNLESSSSNHSTRSMGRLERRCSVTKYNLDSCSNHSMRSLEVDDKSCASRTARAA